MATLTVPDLAGRLARCGCLRTVPSDTALAFFEFRGPGSVIGADSCKNCGYAKVAHTTEVMERNKALKCCDFKARGSFEFDSYYCGHAGWD